MEVIYIFQLCQYSGRQEASFEL